MPATAGTPTIAGKTATAGMPKTLERLVDRKTAELSCKNF
jgi:hypothetical protein